MKDVFKEVFVNYIACAVLGGAFEYLASPKMKKTLRVIVIGIMAIAVFSPFLNINARSLQLPEINEAENRRETLLHIANLTENSIRKEIKDILINLKIDEYEIYVVTDISEDDNTVYLDEVKIEVDKSFENKIPHITELISSEYRSVTKVGVKNE